MSSLKFVWFFSFSIFDPTLSQSLLPPPPPPVRSAPKTVREGVDPCVHPLLGRLCDNENSDTNDEKNSDEANNKVAIFVATSAPPAQREAHSSEKGDPFPRHHFSDISNRCFPDKSGFEINSWNQWNTFEYQRMNFNGNTCIPKAFIHTKGKLIQYPCFQLFAYH